MSIDNVFPKPIEARYVTHGIWNLISPFEYNNPPIRIVVPIGFSSDGASIPSFAWSIIGSPWTGKYARAALVHDFLYFSQIFSRKKSDRIFLDAMKILKVSWWRRRTMYMAVRIFGGRPWAIHKKKQNKNI